MVALFGSTRSFIGLDIGTSSLKLVELLDRRKRVEVATYAQANMPNVLLQPAGTSEDAIRQTANIITRMLDAASVSTDVVVAALPSSVVFSTVLDLPPLPEEDMERAVRFAARDVVPASLEEMVLGWSRVASAPHMEHEAALATSVPVGGVGKENSPPAPRAATVPVFLTAAPVEIVSRYTRLMELLRLELAALEVETFPLVRSLLSQSAEAAMIADIGDAVSTFHIIDAGTARVSNTVEWGGRAITMAVGRALGIPESEAEKLKVTHGLNQSGPAQKTVQQAVDRLLEQARQLNALYASKAKRPITRTVLIGGGANLRGLTDAWAAAVGHTVLVGNPWKGLAYPQDLETRLQELGPTFAVAVGLAQRGFNHV